MIVAGSQTIIST
ncbi:unnamed protein product, partial [Adineta steineri]